MEEKRKGSLFISLAELDISWEDKKENQEKCRRMAKRAASEKVDLLIFPEMTLTGFSMNIEKIAEEKETSQTLEFFLNLSKEYNIAIAFGMAESIIEITQKERQEGQQRKKAVNQCYLVSKGMILLEYTKLHPFTYGEEGKYYQGGTKLSITELNQIRLAPLICYDLRFPEPFQILSAQADFIFIIANWPAEREEHWRTLLRARAIENQCYIAGINRCGKDPNAFYPMASLVYNPYGDRIDNYEKNKMELFDGNLYFARIDKNMVQKYRKEFPLKKDRREMLYLSLRNLKNDNKIEEV